MKKKVHLLAFPVISRSVETGWNFGAASASTFRFFRKDTATRVSNLQSAVLYSTKKQFFAGVNGTVFFPGEKYVLTHRFSYSSYPDKFWGIGNKTPESAAESYSFSQFYINLHASRYIARRFFAGLAFEFQRLLDIDYVTGGIFDQQDFLGKTPYNVSGIGPSISYDSRNDAFFPVKGSFVQVYMVRFDKLLGSSYRYTNYVADIRKYIRLGYQTILCFQGYTSLNAGHVPLRSLASLGGASGMRGYYGGRYMDRNQLLLQTEVRIPVYKRFGAVLFGSAGQVSNRLRELAPGEFHMAGGGGIRFRVNRKEKLNFRLDYGYANRHQQGFIFQIGEAF